MSSAISDEVTSTSRSCAPPVLVILKNAAVSGTPRDGRKSRASVTPTRAGVPALPVAVQTARAPRANTQAQIGARAARAVSASRRGVGVQAEVVIEGSPRG